MNTRAFGRILSAFWSVLVLLGCNSIAQAAEPAAPQIVPLEDNTYSVTRSANSILVRNTSKLEAQAKEDAANYCANQGKQLKVVSVKKEGPNYLRGGWANVTVIFKALPAGHPELMVEQAGAAGSSRAVNAKPTTDSLYAELIKLDELRKKGILTEEEFTALKKKILERAN